MLGNMLSWAGSLMRPECESLQNILTFVVDSTRKIEAGDMRRKVLIVNTLSRYPAFLNSSLAWEMQNLYAKGLRCAVVMDSTSSVVLASMSALCSGFSRLVCSGVSGASLICSLTGRYSSVVFSRTCEVNSRHVRFADPG